MPDLKEIGTSKSQGMTMVTAMLPDVNDNADHGVPRVPADRQRENGAEGTRVAGISGELFISLYEEYYKATEKMTEPVVGCAKTAVGMGVNLMVEVALSMCVVTVVGGVDVLSQAMFHHNKLNVEGTHCYPVMAVDSGSLTASHNALGCSGCETLSDAAECSVCYLNAAVTKEVVGSAECASVTKVCRLDPMASLGDDLSASLTASAGVLGATLAVLNATLKETGDPACMVSVGDTVVVCASYSKHHFSPYDSPTDMNLTTAKEVSATTKKTGFGPCSLSREMMFEKCGQTCVMSVVSGSAQCNCWDEGIICTKAVTSGVVGCTGQTSAKSVGVDLVSLAAVQTDAVDGHDMMRLEEIEVAADPLPYVVAVLNAEKVVVQGSVHATGMMGSMFDEQVCADVRMVKTLAAQVVNHLSGANSSSVSACQVVVASGLQHDAEAAETYYCYKKDVFLGMVSTSVYVVVEGCGAKSDDAVRHGWKGSAGECLVGETVSYVSCGGLAAGDYIATPVGDAECAETMYCVQSCEVPVVGVPCVVSRVAGWKFGKHDTCDASGPV